MSQPLVSIIIRTKNEEDWVARTLNAIESQSYRNYEIIIVDTGSTDRTLELVGKFPCKLITYETPSYRPGAALNAGIRASEGSLLVLLSAHAVPADTTWLETLVRTISEDTQVAGVYGRQLSLPESSPFDKRDLTFQTVIVTPARISARWKQTYDDLGVGLRFLIGFPNPLADLAAVRRVHEDATGPLLL